MRPKLTASLVGVGEAGGGGAGDRDEAGGGGCAAERKGGDHFVLVDRLSGDHSSTALMSPRGVFDGSVLCHSPNRPLSALVALSNDGDLAQLRSRVDVALIASRGRRFPGSLVIRHEEAPS